MILILNIPYQEKSLTKLIKFVIDPSYSWNSNQSKLHCDNIDITRKVLMYIGAFYI